MTAASTGIHGELLRQRARRRRNLAWASTLFLLVAAVAYLLLLSRGSVELTPDEVLRSLTGRGTPRTDQIVWDLRLPVAAATLIIGAALGLAGAWTQTVARNPLASPDILGVSGGAAVAVVTGTVVARPAWSEGVDLFWWRAGLALAGALTAVVLLLALGGVRATSRFVLVGVALSMMAQAAVSYLLLRADLTRAADAQTWLAGSLAYVRFNSLAPLVLGLVPFVILGLAASADLPLLAHDDASATALGVRLPVVRGLLLGAATGIVAVTVSLAGPIGFVALIAPQLARGVSRAPTPPPLVSALAGAALLSACAVAVSFVPSSPPVGLLTSAIGGIVLVFLVIARTRNQRVVA